MNTEYNNKPKKEKKGFWSLDVGGGIGQSRRRFAQPCEHPPRRPPIVIINKQPRSKPKKVASAKPFLFGWWVHIIIDINTHDSGLGAEKAGGGGNPAALR